MMSVRQTGAHFARIYLDESGNSGDLARTGLAFDFGGQEVFALAGVGVADEVALAEELDRLKRMYKVQASELKSVGLKGKPRLVGDLARFLERNDLPLMVELLYKRFSMSASCSLRPTSATRVSAG